MPGMGRYVAKTSMRQGKDLARNVADMEEDINAYMMAKHYADAFNTSMSAAARSSRQVLYHPVNLVFLDGAVDPYTAMFLEPYLDGR